jgi:hypothetical protein
VNGRQNGRIDGLFSSRVSFEGSLLISCWPYGSPDFSIIHRKDVLNQMDGFGSVASAATRPSPHARHPDYINSAASWSTLIDSPPLCRLRWTCLDIEDNRIGCAASPTTWTASPAPCLRPDRIRMAAARRSTAVIDVPGAAITLLAEFSQNVPPNRDSEVLTD